MAVPRGGSRLGRMARGSLAVAAAARWPDVVYANGLFYKSVVAATLHHVPLVVKLTTDPAYERARSLGLFAGDIEAFQRPHRGAAIRYLKLVRRTMLSKPESVVIPSRYLAEIAGGWGLARDRITVVPNPAPAVAQLEPRGAVRRRLGVDGPTFVFVGRLVPAKNLPLAIAALTRVPAARLVVIGDGPEREALTDLIARAGVDGRVVLKGAVPRSEANTWLRAADAALLSSAWENLPHAAVEAIGAGTPVVATAVGGVPEVVEANVNGLLVPAGDEDALVEAMRSVATDAALRERLREGAAASAQRFSADQAYEAIEAVLLAAVSAARGDRASLRRARRDARRYGRSGC
jgi:glycosyltransferase involved in cell wall biosynthesis